MSLLSIALYLNLFYIIYFNIAWLSISFFTKLYKIYRYTKLTDVVSKCFFQFTIYFLSYFAYFSIFKEGVQTGNQFKTLTIIFSGILFFKLLYIIALRKYRFGGGNYINVVILGGNNTVKSLKTLFMERKYLGYHYKGYFADKQNEKEGYLGKLKESFDYVLQNDIDEIYCSIIDFTRKELNNIIEFGKVHKKEIRLIPSDGLMFTSDMNVEYYDYVPVLSLKKLPFDDPLIKYSKRIFDIIFSTLVIVFILSWVSIVLYFFIKISSKGPLIFKQTRDGFNGNQFECYKFRSMSINSDSDSKQVTKGDVRITKIGRFIRKTSIDELPQFINVFLGEMSVVGPRPHMISHSKMYLKLINKYLVRNLVKPGITGLAQVRGYRGEIERQTDIENRVRLDIFYIKKWSLVLDVKIILQTLINVIKGEKKAY